MDVDLYDTGIGRDADYIDTLIMRRRITLYVDWQSKLGGSRLRCCNQLEIVLDAFHWRHEDAEPAITRFHRHGGAHRAADFADRLLYAFLPRGFAGMERSFGHGAARWREDVGKRTARDRGVCLVNIGIGGWRHIGQGAQWQAVTHRAVTRNEEYFTAPRLPFFADPALAGGARIPRLNGKNIAGRCRQSPLEDAGYAVSLLRVLQLGI